ncbi:MAG: HAMP domain-containing protein [Deltaproteobacteria bacterium]|jgi:signal transduction histidine kinase|nr:HAMP domain-containing protein [Deltaproteobacteria bacterium]MBW2529947.1 HAMP domain-containing protein [Deltaproteobacteria bacterium]
MSARPPLDSSPDASGQPLVVSSDGSDGPAPARRTVAGRLVASYLLVLAAFSVTAVWSLLALRDAAHDATLLRAAYVPLRSSIGEALAGQNVLNAQLNHITAAKNPADARQWIETARRLRPLTFEQIRRDAERQLPAVVEPSGLRAHVASEASAMLRVLAADEEKFEQLFQSLGAGDRARAEKIRDELVEAQTSSAKRLRALRERVDGEMKALISTARQRERRSIQLLIGLSVLTLVVGLLITAYARRVLAPLTAVTERARAVARGDLSSRRVVATGDEIGELATTFEIMVAAIKRARAELVQAERLATIGKMAAHISHEVRNPLSSIGLNLELLEEEIAEAGSNPEAKQLLEAIQDEVERLSRVTEQYLAAARRPRLHLEPARIDELVEQCHGFVRPELERAGLSSRVEVAPDLPWVDADSGQLRQALLNLIRNAREAAGKGGEIVLGVSPADDGAVAVTVEDDGPGVPEEVRGTIFEPFTTTKERGTGLGLAVTQAVVEAHGGTIECEPRSEGGTTFTIVLPPSRQSEEPPQD